MNNTVIELKDKNTLEAILDQGTLSRTLELLAEVCHEKADHVLSNWQDKELARAWEHAGNLVATLAINHKINRIS